MNPTPQRAAWRLALAIALLSPFPATAESAATIEVGLPPAAEVERLGLAPFYGKYASYRGFPIVASTKVSDHVLREAWYLIDGMLGDRPDLVAALVENKVRLAIMAVDEYTTDIPEHSDLKPKEYWDRRARGLGATDVRPAVSVGEENLLGLEGDPYATESIFVHEFAHAIHQMGVNAVDPDFQERLEQAFNRASLAGLWKGKYAGTNPSEYWAEAVQSWFDTNRENDHDHNHVDTRRELIEHDPAVAALVESIFGDGEWSYVPPAEREKPGHLEDFDRAAAPVFAWPPEMIAAYEALERGDHLEQVAIRPVATLPSEAATDESGKSLKLRFDNRRKDRISVFWIGFDGLRRHYATVDPGRRHEQQTYGGHLWVVVDEQGTDLGWLPAPEKDGLVAVE